MVEASKDSYSTTSPRGSSRKGDVSYLLTLIERINSVFL